jgi:hypothetical protein
VVGLAWNPRIPSTDRAARALLCIIVTCHYRELIKNTNMLSIWSG